MAMTGETWPKKVGRCVISIPIYVSRFEYQTYFVIFFFHLIDTVGCMVGFYLFTNRDGELYQVYESPFVPETELSTEPSFTIAPVK